MENEASKTRTSNIGFLVDEESLRRLQSLLKEVNGSPEYKVKFSDGSTVRYTDVKEIISQSNSDRRFIVAVIASVEGHPRKSAFLTMRDDPLPSVEYTIRGPQRDVIYFADKLDDWVASCRQWYSVVLTSNLNIIIGFVFLILPLILGAWVARAFPFKIGTVSPLPLITIVAAYAIEIWTAKLFPRGTFAIGWGSKRHQVLNIIRNGVLLAFVVSLVAGVLANMLSRR